MFSFEFCDNDAVPKFLAIYRYMWLTIGEYLSKTCFLLFFHSCLLVWNLQLCTTCVVYVQDAVSDVLLVKAMSNTEIQL